jgi:hypothetical protein
MQSKTLQINTPVAIFFYNRPETLIEVMTQLSMISTPCLYLISDGFEDGNETDRQLVIECRNIANQFRQFGKVETIYRQNRVGLFSNITNGIEEVFKYEDTCIFLEDDTVPSLTFFTYCDELLERYRNSPEIISISGFKLLHNWSNPNKRDQSYFFSRYPQVWGWATWKSKWQTHYDKDLKTWHEWRNSKKFNQLFSSRREAKFWHKKLSNVHESKYTWDSQLAFASFQKSLLTIIPTQNLVTNIGIGHKNATNTRSAGAMILRPRFDLSLPLTHPSSIIRQRDYDNLVAKWYAPTLFARIRARLNRLKRNYSMSGS